MKIKLTTIAIVSILCNSLSAALVFQEDFGALANNTTISTENTNFTYVRTSTGSGAEDPSIISPANIGEGSSGFLQSPSGSLTGVGVQDTLTASNVYRLSIQFRLSSAAAGDIVFGVGSGTAFTGNGTFSTNQGLFWLQSDNGNFERRTSGGWSDIGDGITLTDDTSYTLLVIANGSAAGIDYGTGTVAAGTMDIYLNGDLLDDNVAVTTNGLSADGFRIYSLNGTGVEIDNIQLHNTAIPEPSTYVALFGLAAIGFMFLRRRNKQ